MDMKKDPLKPATDDKPKLDTVSKEKETKAIVRESLLDIPEKPIVKEAKPASETGDAKRTEKPQVKEPVAASVAQTRKKEEPDLAGSLDKLEEKITRNMEQFKKIDEKLKDADFEIDELEEKKQKETLGQKAKKIVMFAPSICVEANVCRYPKALCKGCRKMVDVWKTASKAGMKAMGELAGKCADSLSTGMRLPIIRMKINKDFKRLGDRAYKMYLEGDKEVLKNAEVKRLVDEVKDYEKQIEVLETHLTKLNEQPIAQKQTA